MTAVDDVLRVAHAELGYIEQGGHGHDGNVTKYWAELLPAAQGQSWCAAFVSWVFRHAGHPLPPIDHPFGFTYCPAAVAWAKAHGYWSSSGHYAPGDVVLYCWDRSGIAEHTGIVVDDDGQTLTTIEGNTSPGDAGSQSNGGGVYLRHRPHGPAVLGVLQASRLLAQAAHPASSSSRRFAMLLFGVRGVDHDIADLVHQLTQRGVVTCDQAEAKAAIGRGEPVVVIGGPAAAALGLQATPGQIVVAGQTQVVVGATATDTLELACQLIH